MEIVSETPEKALPDDKALEEHGLRPNASAQILEIALNRRQISTGEMARLIDPQVLVDRSRFAIAIAWLAGFLKGMNIAIVTGKAEVEYKQKFPAPKRVSNQEILFKRNKDIEQIDDMTLSEGIEILEFDAEQKRDYKAFKLDPSLEWYMRKIRHPLLSQHEELTLGKKMLEEGDINARNKLISHNLRLAAYLAKKYLWSGWELLDLIEEANVGLITAADKYDYRRGLRFSTMASWWIKQALQRAIQDTGKEIRMPVYIQQTRYAILRISRELEQELDRIPTLEEIAKKMLKPVDFIKTVMEHTDISVVSLHSAKAGEDESAFGDRLEDSQAEDPFILLQAKEEIAACRERIGAFLETLKSLPISGRDKKFFMEYYQLVDIGRKATLESVALKEDLTRERVRQINMKTWVLLAELKVDMTPELLDAEFVRLDALSDIVDGSGSTFVMPEKI